MGAFARLVGAGTVDAVEFGEPCALEALGEFVDRPAVGRGDLVRERFGGVAGEDPDHADLV